MVSRPSLIRIELVEADKTDVVALAGLQFTVEDDREGARGPARPDPVQAIRPVTLLRTAAGQAWCGRAASGSAAPSALRGVSGRGPRRVAPSRAPTPRPR